MKRDFRSRLLKKRNELSNKEISNLSYKIYKNIIKIPEYINSNNFLVYLDFNKEVSTKIIIEDLIKNNKNLYIPISKPDTLELIISKLNSMDDLVPSTYGILEPKQDKIELVSSEIIDFVIVPGVVFDREGYRIGYGKGYYDRFLSTLKQKFTTVGICYDFQLVKHVPRDIYDFKLDYIVTDKEIIKTI